MKLFVQARKDGYNVLYPKPTPTEFFQFAGDIIRIDRNAGNYIGKNLYSIAFASDGCIFTKYLIVQDVQRENLGNIGFSVHIPNYKKLSGVDVKTLLDELAKTYCQNYCPEYYLDRKQEDWVIFSSLLNNYNTKLRNVSADDAENMQSGNTDESFIYYSSDTELQKYFENPFQEEYTPYRQILLISSDLKDRPENPLNALRHNPNANLTGKIDLENPKYKLLFNQQARGGVKIEVKADGRFRSNKNKIYRKEELEITWTKQFYNTKIQKGKWDEIGSEYLIINDPEQTITVKEIDLIPITYTFDFETKDRFSNPVRDAEIILKCDKYPEHKAINNKVTLTAGELQYKWSVIATKDNLISAHSEITIEDATKSIVLTLQEHKKVTFTITDDNGSIYDYRIQINDKKEQAINGVVEFVGDEIGKTWQVSVSHRDYETTCFPYCPEKDKSPKYVELQKRLSSGRGHQDRDTPKEKRYYIKIDEKRGERWTKGKLISDYVYSPPPFKCDARFGYKFEKWEPHINQKYNIYDGYYEAVFKKSWYNILPKWAWFFIAIAIALAATFVLIEKFGGSGSEQPESNSEISSQINSYPDEIELDEAKLNKYKSEFCKAKDADKSDDADKSLWQKFWPFGAKDNEKLAQESTNLPNYCSKLDNALAIRKAINLGKIDELKGKDYSEQQQNFKEAIESIDDKYKKQIGDTLYARSVSQMDLNKVANLIIKVQKEIKGKEQNDQQKIEQQKQEQQRKQEQHQPQKQEEHHSQPQPQKQGNSLEKEFWELVNDGCVNKDTYTDLLKKHESEGGDIINYLNKICKNSKAFKEFKDIPAIDRKSAEKLSQIDIK